MTLLRLLSASIIATACVLPAAAQSPAAPADPTRPIPELLIPPLSTKNVPLLLQSPPPASPSLLAAPDSRIVALSAGIKNSGPCYTIRTYGYTPHDLESNTPKPSSYSTCTPAATHAFKNAAPTVTLGSPSSVK